MMQQYDVVVIGAGASGLMCAATAAKRGRKVLAIDSSRKNGSKILMSGGGSCNFTNLYVSPDYYVSTNPHFCKSALSRYTQWDFIALIEAYGIDYHEREHGQLFCDGSARQVLHMLLKECELAGARILSGCNVERVAFTDRYQLFTDEGGFSCQSLVVATGGLSIPSMGSSDLGYRIARQFGLKIVEPRAGLVPFTFSDAMRELTARLSGLSLPVTLSCRGQSFTEQLLFTHRGLSGPVCLQLSNYWMPGDVVTIDLLPGQDGAGLLKEMKQEQPRGRIKTLLAGCLPKKLVQELMSLWWPDHAEAAIGGIPDKELHLIGQRLNGWQLKPAGTEGYRTAEVTLGGVDTDALSSRNMECKGQPGLFFVGEVVDVTGHLGGFNFQWAWSSGHAAGEVV